MKFQERLLRAAGYKNTDFFEKESIGVIGRGPSIRFLELCYDKFDHCFLAGEFNNNLDFLSALLLGKEIVLSIMQFKRYRTPVEKCYKFNIKNVQVPYHNNSEEFKNVIDYYPDLKVVGYTFDQISEMKRIFLSQETTDNSNSFSIYTTGIIGVFNASYFRPKKVIVIGIDFYNTEFSKYVISEPHDDQQDTTENSASRMRDGMLRDLKLICNFYSDIEYYIYTTFMGLKSERNINVIYVGEK